MPASQVRHPLFARFYARISAGMEEAGTGEHRRALLAGLAGSVLELGAGNGLNFRYYPAAVSEVVAIEPEPHLRALARQRARAADRPVRVLDGTAERLPAPDHSFDACVATLMLCSVAEVAVVLREVRRVLRPGGELRFMEHVRASSAGHRWVQRVADATFWPSCCGGCHCSRDPVASISQGGFRVVQLTQYRLPDSRIPWPTAPHARGVAVRAD